MSLNHKRHVWLQLFLLHFYFQICFPLMRNTICNDPILLSNECDFAIKLQEGTENLDVIFFPFFLRVQLQRIGSPRGCSPPAGQWANLRVPPTIFHCERQGCTLCPDPAKPRLHRRAFFFSFFFSPRLKKVGSPLLTAASTLS